MAFLDPVHAIGQVEVGQDEVRLQGSARDQLQPRMPVERCSQPGSRPLSSSRSSNSRNSGSSSMARSVPVMMGAGDAIAVSLVAAPRTPVLGGAEGTEMAKADPRPAGSSGHRSGAAQQIAEPLDDGKPEPESSAALTRDLST